MENGIIDTLLSTPIHTVLIYTGLLFIAAGLFTKYLGTKTEDKKYAIPIGMFVLVSGLLVLALKPPPDTFHSASIQAGSSTIETALSLYFKNINQGNPEKSWPMIKENQGGQSQYNDYMNFWTKHRNVRYSIQKSHEDIANATAIVKLDLGGNLKIIQARYSFIKDKSNSLLRPFNYWIFSGRETL